MGIPNKVVVAKDQNAEVVNVNIRMLKSTLTELRHEAIRRELTVSDLISEALATRRVNPLIPETPFERDARKRAGK